MIGQAQLVDMAERPGSQAIDRGFSVDDHAASGNDRHNRGTEDNSDGDQGKGHHLTHVDQD